MNKHFRFSGSTFGRLEKLGVSAAAVLRQAGLSQSLLNEPRVLLSTAELHALWKAIGEMSVAPGIGLQLGTETKIERFHPVGIAALSSESFGAAMDRMARYKLLTCPEEIVQKKKGGEWSIEFKWLLTT